MNWLTNLFSSGASTLIDSVGNTIDKLVTSDEEKLMLKNQLTSEMNKLTIALEDKALQYEKEISNRHSADMQSDSWLSKNIRPLTLIFILVMYSFLSISSGFEFDVTESYVELLGQWGMLIMSFYFGGRSLEKIVKIKKA